MKLSGGISFCLTNMNISNFEEFDLLHNDFRFRKAKENEILQYKEKLNKYPTFVYEVFGKIDYIYEYSWKAIEDGNSTKYEKDFLEEKIINIGLLNIKKQIVPSMN